MTYGDTSGEQEDGPSDGAWPVFNTDAVARETVAHEWLMSEGERVKGTPRSKAGTNGGETVHVDPTDPRP